MEASSPPCACGMSSSPHVSELALSATVCGPSSAWQESRPKHVPVLHAVPCDWPLPSFAWSRAACAFALHAEIPYLLWNCGRGGPAACLGVLGCARPLTDMDFTKRPRRRALPAERNLSIEKFYLRTLFSMTSCADPCILLGELPRTHTHRFEFLQAHSVHLAVWSRSWSTLPRACATAQTARGGVVLVTMI